MSDLTVLYYTANVLREPFASKIRDVLWRAKEDCPLISISHKPMNYGKNIVVNLERGIVSIYRQILVGAQVATTDFVAMAEDDCLYSKEHFSFRPNSDEFAYDKSRWSIYSWSNPSVFSYKDRISNSTMIAPRKLLIEALEERFAKYPDESKIPLRYFSEPGKYEKYLGVKIQKIRVYNSKVPSITFSHSEALGYEYQGNHKKLGELQAYEIPVWGKAADIIQNFYL